MFASDLGFAFRDVVDGDPATLRRVAALAGASAEALIHNAARREADGWRLRGQFLLKSSLHRTSLRLCPACIAQDLRQAPSSAAIGAYGRLHWQVASIRTCATHGVALVQPVPAPPAHLAHDFFHLVAPCQPLILERAAQAPTHEPSKLDADPLPRNWTV